MLIRAVSVFCSVDGWAAPAGCRVPDGLTVGRSAIGCST
jgi:hypothetical protein